VSSDSDQELSGNNSEVESDGDEDELDEENLLESVEEEQDQSLEGQEAPNTSAKKVKKKAVDYHISKENEDTTIQWIKAYPMLYDKHIKDYKKVTKKRELWTNKGKELGLTYLQILTWYLSLRTRFGRLLKFKNSGGHPQRGKYTDREEWLMTKFDFLTKHIFRQKVRKVSK
jgi:hypothetical protein